MKVILLKDVKALGKKGEIVEVSEGYGRNFILPTKTGVPADAKNLNTLKLQLQNAENGPPSHPPQETSFLHEHPQTPTRVQVWRKP